MASELRVNTLKDASGNNSVGMSTVAEGSAKAWVHWNGESTAAIRDSFNFASLSDSGTGDYTFSYTTSQSDTTYCSTVSTSRASNAQALISSSTTFNTANIDSVSVHDEGVAEDTENGCLAVHGDLA